MSRDSVAERHGASLPTLGALPSYGILQLAMRWGVSRGTVYRLVREHRLPLVIRHISPRVPAGAVAAFEQHSEVE